MAVNLTTTICQAASVIHIHIHIPGCWLNHKLKCQNQNRIADRQMMILRGSFLRKAKKYNIASSCSSRNFSLSVPIGRGEHGGGSALMFKQHGQFVGAFPGGGDNNNITKQVGGGEVEKKDKFV